MLICKVCRKSWPLLVDLSHWWHLTTFWSKLFPRLLEAYWKWCLFCSPCAVPMYPVIISLIVSVHLWISITLDWGMHSGKISWLTHFPDKIFMTWRFHLYKSWMNLFRFFFLSLTFFKQAHKFFLNVHEGKHYEWIDGCTFQLHAFLIFTTAFSLY